MWWTDAAREDVLVQPTRFRCQHAACSQREPILSILSSVKKLSSAINSCHFAFGPIHLASGVMIYERRDTHHILPRRFAFLVQTMRSFLQLTNSSVPTRIPHTCVKMRLVFSAKINTDSMWQLKKNSVWAKLKLNAEFFSIACQSMHWSINECAMFH
jgi:hypothetical protein